VDERFKQLVYNLLIGAYLLAMVFGNIIGGVLPSWMHNSKNPYFLAGLASGICFILMGIGRSMLPAYRVPEKSKRSFFKIIMNKKILSYIIYGIITSTFLNMINAMLNLVFRDTYKLPDGTIGIIFSIISIAGSIAAFIVPYLAGKFKGANVAVVTMIIQSVVISCMSFAGTYIFSLFIIVRSFVGCITQGNVDSYMLQSVSEHERGAYSGVRIFGNNIGMAIGAALAGTFTMGHSYAPLFLTAGGITVIQIFIYKVLCKKYFTDNN
jgi:MFS family permease